MACCMPIVQKLSTASPARSKTTGSCSISSSRNSPNTKSICRPREKLLHQGVAALSDAELLALFIRTGLRDLSALDLAREMLQKASGLRSLLALEWAQAKKLRGMGLARYCELHGALELGRRCMQQNLQRGEVLTSDGAATALIQATLQDQKVEVFLCLSLDNQLRLMVGL